jgi:hypothetical protein
MSEKELKAIRVKAAKKAAKALSHEDRVRNAKAAWVTIRANRAKAKKAQPKAKSVPKKPAAVAA